MQHHDALRVLEIVFVRFVRFYSIRINVHLLK